jgi:hypothetical protein
MLSVVWEVETGERMGIGLFDLNEALAGRTQAGGDD